MCQTLPVVGVNNERIPFPVDTAASIPVDFGTWLPEGDEQEHFNLQMAGQYDSKDPAS
jgi:hypothetical protein